MKLVLIIPLLMLMACSETVEPVSEQTSNDKPVLKTYQHNIEKAKQMEKQLLEAAEQKKKAIDDQLQ